MLERNIGRNRDKVSGIPNDRTDIVNLSNVRFYKVTSDGIFQGTKTEILAFYRSRRAKRPPDSAFDQKKGYDQYQAVATRFTYEDELRMLARGFHKETEDNI